jgi:hypothetical protein
MKISMADSGVPFVVSYRKILRKPKLVRQRKFVGPVQLVKNILLKAVEFIDDVTYETTTETIDPGQSVAVHWAITVEDPWDVPPGREANLIAYRMAGDMPPCGAHFEIISQPKQQAEPEEVSELAPEDLRSDKGSVWAGMNNARTAPPSRPPAQGNGRFVRPPDPAYAPRPVEPLVDELIGPPESGVQTNEVPADVDGAGGLREDDEGAVRSEEVDEAGARSSPDPPSMLR